MKNKKEYTFLKYTLKTISYRVMGTLITFLTAMSLNVPFKISAVLSLGELVIKPIFYFLHEMFWDKKLF
jgi:uncharacterized membrane protein